MAEPNSPRKRGNPNWGRPMPPAPVLATAFEDEWGFRVEANLSGSA
jgi:hypothetical protein